MNKIFKRMVCLFCVLSLLLPAALAAPNGDLDVEFYNPALGKYETTRASVVNLMLDGASFVSDMPAMIWQERTMVPVRLLSEKMGAAVSWVNETNQVIVRRGGTTIVLTLGSATALVNGQSVTLYGSIPAALARLNNAENVVERTMVPLRFVSEQLGCQVDWNQETYTASIRVPDARSGVVNTIHADANAQTVLISTDKKPEYKVQDLGDRVVVDLLGMRLGSGFPGAIKVDNELISNVRYAEHENDLYPDYDHSVRVVLDLKSDITYQKNVKIEAMDQGVVLTTFLPDREEINFTPSTPLDSSKKTIVVDAGHGGNAPGAKYEGISEKTINLAVAKKLESILKDNGYNVVMTRTDDSSVGLYERADIANAVKADVFVSVHSNASETNLQAQGIYTYYHPTSKRGAKLGTAIQGPVTEITGARNRGIMSADFVVLRETKMCAVLVEMGFMSTHEELMKLISDTYQDKLARGIAEGVVRYLNAK